MKQIKIFTKNEYFTNYPSRPILKDYQRENKVFEDNINSWLKDNQHLNIIDIKPISENSVMVVWKKRKVKASNINDC